MLDLRLFGHMEVRGPDGPIDLANAKLSGLLAYLALAGKRPVPREQLTELLWGSHFEEQARQNFRQALSRLRKLLGGDIFASEDQFIQLNPTSIRSDVAQFEALLRDNSHQGVRDATRLADGDLLEGIAIKEPGFTDWIESERRRIAKLVLEALLKLGEAELAEGALDAAHASAQAAIARDEYNEAAHRLLMRAEAAAGRKSEALRHFQNFSARLSKYLGTAPEAETLALAASLRDGGSAGTAPALEPGRPSIAVMPFANLSNDPEQEYFADGMVDDIIVALSRFSWLTVIARNSTLGYKGRVVDARHVCQELGVRYILEGSVRKSGDQLRISGQLIDAKTDGTIWADRFDGRLQNVFELQDQVASKAVSAIGPKLEQVEIERARKKPTENLDAYDHYLRGVAELNRWTRDGNREALKHFYRAIELDRRFAAAYGQAARTLSQRFAGNWSMDEAQERAETDGLAALAVEFGRDDPVALSAAGIAIAYVNGRNREGGDLVDRALSLNPNLPHAWALSGWIKAWTGDAEEAIVRVNRAMTLNPMDPYTPSMKRIIAMAHFIAGRYEQAMENAKDAARMPQATLIAIATVASSAMHLGRHDEGKEAMAALLKIAPEIRATNLRSKLPKLREVDFVKFAEGLRLAGLPE